MQQPNNFTIIQSFAGKIITTGKTKGRENNKYNLVKNTFGNSPGEERKNSLCPA